jgi:hypothetical protein
MKFRKFFEAPWVDTPDHATYDLGLEFLGGDVDNLRTMLNDIFSGKRVNGPHDSFVELRGMDDKQKFKQELIEDPIFLSYCRKVFNISSGDIIDIIDDAIKESELVTVEGVDSGDKKITELGINGIGKYLTNPKFRVKHRDATLSPSDQGEYHDQMSKLAHKHQNSEEKSKDIGELAIDGYHLSDEYRSKMRSVLSDIFSSKSKFDKVMKSPESKKKFSKIYNSLKKSVGGSLSDILKALNIPQPGFLQLGEQLEEEIVEGVKLFGLTPESIEEEIGEMIKTISDEVFDRRYEVQGYKYSEEAEEGFRRCMRNHDLIGALVNKGAEKSIDFEVSLEDGIKRAILMITRQIDIILTEKDIDQILQFMSGMNIKSAINFINTSYDKGELEWVIFFEAVKKIMKETGRITPGAFEGDVEDDEP